jgi:hypothetical protein
VKGFGRFWEVLGVLGAFGSFGFGFCGSLYSFLFLFQV